MYFCMHMSKLHIANTFFEHELSSMTIATGQGMRENPHTQNIEARSKTHASDCFGITHEMRRSPIYLQLQFLPYLYADPSDGLAVSDLPDPNYYNTLKDWKLPRLNVHSLEERSIPSYEQIESWGASQLIAAWAKEHRLPYITPDWPLLKTINAKSFSFEHTPHLPHAALLRNKEDACAWLDSFSGPKILKNCFGLSGTGHFFIEPSTSLEQIFSFLNHEWKQARPVIAEPWVDRTLDFSTQWVIEATKKISYLGPTVCLNDARGKYVASRVGNETALFGEHLPFLEQHKTAAHKLLMHLADLGYYGNIGFDAMIYRSQHELKLHPIVEINARKTMGYAMLLLQQKHFPDKILTIRFGAHSEGLLPTSLRLTNGKQVVFKRNLQIESALLPLQVSTFPLRL